jgi:hypothetical protein
LAVGERPGTSSASGIHESERRQLWRTMKGLARPPARAAPPLRGSDCGRGGKVEAALHLAAAAWSHPSDRCPGRGGARGGPREAQHRRAGELGPEHVLGEAEHRSDSGRAQRRRWASVAEMRQNAPRGRGPSAGSAGSANFCNAISSAFMPPAAFLGGAHRGELPGRRCSASRRSSSASALAM